MNKRTARRIDTAIIGLSFFILILAIVFGLWRGTTSSSVSTVMDAPLETAFQESGAEFLTLTARCWSRIDTEFHNGRALADYYARLREVIGDDDLLSFEEYDDDGYAGFSISGMTEHGYILNLVVQSLGNRNTEDETYMIVELSDENSVHNLDDARRYLDKLFAAVSAECDPAFVIEGCYDELKSTRQKKSIAKNVFRVLDGKIEEKVKDGDYVSYSGFSDRFTDYVDTDQHKINIQAALSDNEEEKRTHIYLGTPVVFSDF